jgi:hypothetical protein
LGAVVGVPNSGASDYLVEGIDLGPSLGLYLLFSQALSVDDDNLWHVILEGLEVFEPVCDDVFERGD